MGEVGEVCEILQWKGEVHPGVPELTEEEKNQVSHRGKALQLMKEELKKYEDTDRK